MAKLKPEDIALNSKIAIRIKELMVKANPNQSKFAECHFIDRQLVIVGKILRTNEEYLYIQ